MGSGTRKLTQKIIAVIVIVALLGFVGVSPMVIIFFVGIGLLVWRAAQRAENQETERIFDFYVSADEILREKERHWYGFEIAEVIHNGERVLCSMPDAPPLSYFSLGALYHCVGEFELAIENLERGAENESLAERYRAEPSPQLRRYVETLRKIEREPSLAPQVMAATRNLERSRRKAADLIADSRQRLAEPTMGANKAELQTSSKAGVFPIKSVQSPGPITAPPPICEVLHDVYQEEKTA
jgi:hypothetical protein